MELGMSLLGMSLLGGGLFGTGLAMGEVVGVVLVRGLFAGRQGLATVAEVPLGRVDDVPLGFDVRLVVGDGVEGWLPTPLTVDGVPAPTLVDELVPAFADEPALADADEVVVPAPVLPVPVLPTPALALPLGLGVLLHGPTVVPVTAPGLPATLPALPATAGVPEVTAGVPCVTPGLPVAGCDVVPV